MKQITVLADDKVGILADISFILGRAKINIESIDVNVAGGKAVINLTVRDEKRASELLRANHYKVFESDIIVVQMPDVPGELSKMSKLLSDAGVNIELVHMLTRGTGTAVYSIKVDKLAKAQKVLSAYIHPEA